MMLRLVMAITPTRPANSKESVMRVVSLILGIVCLGFAFNASAKPVFMGLGDLP
ncbi:MAG: hypothetical protein HRU01_21385, partial [Myxococcales bacterium]|nr:hypothetical protein [Myxococcales bacterium]